MTRQPARGIDRPHAARLASCAGNIDQKKADTIMRIGYQNTVVIHRFGIGNMVRVSATFRLPNAAAGTYRIVAQLPQRDGEFQYRIKSDREPYDRVVKEDELRFA
jgi:hypothetical protein